MIRRHANLLGWMLIAAVTALSFVLDHYRILLSHFNWFMAILMVVSVALVGAIVRLSWSAMESERSTDARTEEE